MYYEQIYKIIYNKWSQNRKIAFIDVQEIGVWAQILNMMGIPSDYSIFKENIVYYAKNHYFLIIGKFDEETKNILEDNQLVAGEDYLLCLHRM